MGSRIEGAGITRREAVAAAAAGMAALALGAVAGRARAAEDSVELDLEGEGVSAHLSLSGAGTSRMSVSYEVTAHAEGALVTGAEAVLRPIGADGFYLDQVVVGIDLSGSPLADGATASGSCEVDAGGEWARAEARSFRATGTVEPVWEGSGVCAAVLDEERSDGSVRVTLALSSTTGSAVRVDALTLHCEVFDASGEALGVPDLVVVDASGDPLELAPSATVECSMGWRESAAGWRVTGAEASVAGGVEVWETVGFGSYPQSGDDPEPIEWLVLDERDGKRLLLSKYALDCKPYNEEWEDTTWEECTLRSWLNSDFLDAAFTADEQVQIAEAAVANDDNPDYGTEGGVDTVDRVFLLSIEEACSYFGVQTYESSGEGSADLLCAPTARAVAEGATVWTAEDREERVSDYPWLEGATTDSCFWWLRSPGGVADFAADVTALGIVDSYGLYVDYGVIAVRPALWVSNL